MILQVLNTTFKQKSSHVLNKNAGHCGKIPRMDATAKRLYECALLTHGVSGQSSLARALNVSPQVVKNWESRGVSKQGLLDAERVMGCSALWIKTGRGRGKKLDE